MDGKDNTYKKVDQSVSLPTETNKPSSKITQNKLYRNQLIILLTHLTQRQEGI